MANTRTLTGSRVLLKIGGRTVGDAEGVTINERNNLGTNDPLGQAHAAEHVNIGYSIEGSFTAFRVYQQDLIAIGVDVDKTTLQNLMHIPETYLEVYDILESGAVERITGVKFENHSRQYIKNFVSKRDITFKGIIGKSEEQS